MEHLDVAARALVRAEGLSAASPARSDRPLSQSELKSLWLAQQERTEAAEMRALRERVHERQLASTAVLERQLASTCRSRAAACINRRCGSACDNGFSFSRLPAGSVGDRSHQERTRHRGLQNETASEDCGGPRGLLCTCGHDTG
jgi:hypothetical protein